MRYELSKAKYLLDSEYDALIGTLERFKEKDARNVTLLFMAVFTGARASELLNITSADLDHTEKAVLIRGLKGSDNREMPLPAWLFDRLAAIAPEVGRVFPISYVRFYQIWCDYRPVKKKLHALRHTFAIRLYRKTNDIRLLQVALGHRSWGNTMIYAAYQYKTAELRRAMLG